MPSIQSNDYFAVAPANDLCVAKNDRKQFIFKYSAVGTTTFENVATGSSAESGSTALCSVSYLSSYEGIQATFKWPKFFDYIPINKVMGFLSFYAEIEHRSYYKEFKAYAQYFHQTIAVLPSATIFLSSSGPDLSFSISPSVQFNAESHPMRVMANNPYYSGS